MTPSRVTLAIPRLRPDWELASLAALMKPQERTRRAVGRAEPYQSVSEESVRAAAASLKRACDRLDLPRPQPVVSVAGDYHLFAVLPLGEAARGVAVAVSVAVPDVWVTFDRLFLKAGRFYRRERGYKLTVREATNVHLTREVRTRLRDLLRPPAGPPVP